MASPAQQISFFVGSFVIPALLVVFSFVVRNSRGWYYTAGSDPLMMLLGFNCSAVALVHDVAPYLRNENIRGAAPAIFMTMSVLLIIAWYWAAEKVETEVHDAIRRHAKPSELPQGKIFLAWSLVVIFMGLDFALFFVG
jgi:ATP/ADP translocase